MSDRKRFNAPIKFLNNNDKKSFADPVFLNQTSKLDFSKFLAKMWQMDYDLTHCPTKKHSPKTEGCTGICSERFAIIR